MKLQAKLGGVVLAVASLAAVGGCKSDGGREAGWSGPEQPVTLSVEGWRYDNKPARKVLTPHYVLNTTVQDNRFLDNTAQVMEGAYQEYLKMVPGLAVSDKPMDCFLFETRVEWERFTRANTGAFAPLYLRINRGGYAVRDWYVAYYMGDYSTYSVAAHEGWHQFCGRNFKGRVPPFLEEGIATMFEGVSLAGPHGLPRWNFAVNLNRAVKLREAVQERHLYPLEELIKLHAGDVVGEGFEKVDAFYAQDWAFARFMWERHREALQRMLTETASGRVYDPAAKALRPASAEGWRPEAARGILEHYLGMPFAQIEKEYNAFVSKVAFEQFQAQWAS